jgi:hypothetical protein
VVGRLPGKLDQRVEAILRHLDRRDRMSVDGDVDAALAAENEEDLARVERKPQARPVPGDDALFPHRPAPAVRERVLRHGLRDRVVGLLAGHDP